MNKKWWNRAYKEAKECQLVKLLFFAYTLVSAKKRDYFIDSTLISAFIIFHLTAKNYLLWFQQHFSNFYSFVRSCSIEMFAYEQSWSQKHFQNYVAFPTLATWFILHTHCLWFLLYYSSKSIRSKKTEESKRSICVLRDEKKEE